MIVVALLLAFCGWASLSVAQSGRARLVASLLLAASLGACLGAWDWRQAIVGWFGLLSVTGVALVIGLPLVRRLKAPAARPRTPSAD